MTDRKKLIELLDAFSTPITLNEEKLLDWTIPMAGLRRAIADYLLANGVTFATDNNVGRWIPVTERLPERGKVVLACGSRGGIYTAFYKGSRYWHKLNSRSHFCEPTHWMPLPEPPQ